jgi:hypothetical protein
MFKVTRFAQHCKRVRTIKAERLLVTILQASKNASDAEFVVKRCRVVQLALCYVVTLKR